MGSQQHPAATKLLEHTQTWTLHIRSCKFVKNASSCHPLRVSFAQGSGSSSAFILSYTAVKFVTFCCAMIILATS